MKRLNGRQRTALCLVLVLVALIAVATAGLLLSDTATLTDLGQKNRPPSAAHLFGTDQLGRDMMARTLSGLALSLGVGLLTAVLSVLLALALGLAAATLGKCVDGAVALVIDLMMGVPHILLLILVSLAFGRGLVGVLAAMSLTHWPSLARLLRGELLQLRGRTYIKAAEKLGMGRLHMAKKHYLPHLLPQFITGAVLTLPHAILHESALTFLGFGLSPETPAIGVILAESMGYLAAGRWWLALFPGLLLVLAVVLFSAIAHQLTHLFNPDSIHR